MLLVKLSNVTLIFLGFKNSVVNMTFEFLLSLADPGHSQLLVVTQTIYLSIGLTPIAHTLCTSHGCLIRLFASTF